MEENRNLLGESASIARARHLIHQVAQSATTVLLRGESGTGKELAARMIHLHSDRAKGPFVAINCAAIPFDLLESELFGHEKGAFTGALNRRVGRFELAQQGTLFLDEIGDMPLSMQVKLLRVLQEKTFERLGGHASQPFDVRIIAATHQNLEQAIEKGLFRADLYYRLNVFPINLPSLRDRKEDIVLLIHHYVEQYRARTGHFIQLTPEAEDFLKDYDWPGNIRELFNAIERLLILFPNQCLQVPQLLECFEGAPRDRMAKPISVPSQKRYLKGHIEALELALIHSALQENRGVVAKAAKKLGLRRTTLVEKMKKYGIERDIQYSASGVKFL